MKNINLFALLVSFTFIFSSCSSNETLLPEEQSLDLLKAFTINRDDVGAYSLDYNLYSNAKVENVVDLSTNASNIYLYPSDNQISRRLTQKLTIEGTQLQIGFVDTNSGKSPNITITDDNLFLAKGSDSDFLKDYSISSNLDGTYTLDFSVVNEVKVDFVFNEELKIHEIHLEEGKMTESSFSRILEKEEGKALKFDFVNHITDGESKGVLETVVRKPRGTIL